MPTMPPTPMPPPLLPVVGAAVGLPGAGVVGAAVGDPGLGVGATVGATEVLVGAAVGVELVGAAVGVVLVGEGVGWAVGGVGGGVGCAVGAAVGGAPIQSPPVHASQTLRLAVHSAGFVWFHAPSVCRFRQSSSPVEAPGQFCTFTS